MNLIIKTRNFIYLKRLGVSTRAAALSFKGPLTDGDKYALTMLVLVLAIVAVVMNVPAMDCGVVQ
jgi:hypothetical protein